MKSPGAVLNHGMRRLAAFPIILVAAMLAQDASAATRRALIIGINDYSSGGNGEGGRGKWTDLDGAINDVKGLQEILVSKHGFPRENIKTLINKEATRNNILNAYKSTLIDPVQKDDVCLFYYAGHGSQVNNSKTDEPDGKDETIVPADGNRGEWDIRDKEIARLFNDTLDKQARLTVLFDSCHSGSIARGPAVGKARSLEGDSRDIAALAQDEKPDPRGRPETRKNGALIMSAAQDHQLAYEAIDSEGLPHGSFSLALQRALLAGPTQSAAALYKRTRGLMQANGINQDPVMAGPPERFSQPLFGGDPDEAFGGTVVTVLGNSQGYIEVDGGRAVGLSAGCQLVKVDDESIQLEIESLESLNLAKGKIKKGRASSVSKGDLFRLEKWAAPDEAHLQAWIAPAMEYDKIISVATAMEAVRADSAIKWVHNPTEDKVTHEMRWTGNGWQLDAEGASSTKLGMNPSASDVISAIKKSKGPARFFLNLPPTQRLSEAIGLNNVDAKTSIVPAKSIETAQYVLYGRINEGLVEYAWVQPSATIAGNTANTLPARGDWLEMAADSKNAQDIGTDLWGHAKSLGRIRAWITLDGPPDSTSFPYKLRVKQLSTGRLLDGGEIAEKGQEYQLVLTHTNPQSRRAPQKRYVYVFVLDSYGNSALMFPPLGQGNVENNVPFKMSMPMDTEIPLGDPFQLGPPYGLDTYVLLTSKEAIDSPDTVLDAQGIRTRGAPPSTELGSLLSGIGGATRGARQSTPTSWSIDRLSFTSKPE